jgi:hypothetical protein
MTLTELMSIIEIENLDEFEFFEHFSALMECTEEIDYDTFFKVLADVEPALLAELTENYFDDLIQGVPDDAMTLYSLIFTVRTTLSESAKEAGSREDRIFYVEELYRFRNWYMFDSIVLCKRINDDLLHECTLFEALTLFRLEKLGEDKFDYDFTHVLDYPIDDFISINTEEDFDESDDLVEDDNENDLTLIDEEHPVIEEEGNYNDEDF